jgi:broad specificity polyphosphatase/5'/3'-nucleotidase SurE
MIRAGQGCGRFRSLDICFAGINCGVGNATAFLTSMSVVSSVNRHEIRGALSIGLSLFARRHFSGLQ